MNLFALRKHFDKILHPFLMWLARLPRHANHWTLLGAVVGLGYGVRWLVQGKSLRAGRHADDRILPIVHLRPVGQRDVTGVAAWLEVLPVGNAPRVPQVVANRCRSVRRTADVRAAGA